MQRYRTVFPLACLLLFVALEGAANSADDKVDEEGFVTIFNGHDLDGWKASELPENWTVEEGAIVGRGPRSHLFFMTEEFGDCEFKADVKLNKGGNSGMYFRTEVGPGWPKGYEAQVNNSGRDPIKTGSLYKLKNVTDQLIEDDTWWNQHIIVKGNHIVIKVNGKTVVDFVDEENRYKKGHLALQQHDPGSVVQYKNIKVKKLNAAK